MMKLLFIATEVEQQLQSCTGLASVLILELGHSRGSHVEQSIFPFASCPMVQIL